MQITLHTTFWILGIIACCSAAILRQSAPERTVKINTDASDSLGSNTVISNQRALAITPKSGQKRPKFNSFKQRMEKLQTFNRPVGTESLVVNNDNSFGNSETSYGRTFGQYGSYRAHKSWQNAVANDRLRNQIGTPGDMKLNFPWVMDNLQKPTLNGFGWEKFWNSYAVPEGTPTVAGLGPQKPLEKPTDRLASRFQSWQ